MFRTSAAKQAKKTECTETTTTMRKLALITTIAATAGGAAQEDPVTVGYDQLPNSGSRYSVGGVVFQMEIVPNRDLVIESFEFRVRNNQTSTWDYTLHHRNGSLMDSIDGAPAHRVGNAWEVVGSAPGIASPSSAEWLEIELDGGLSLGPGMHSFYFDSTLSPGASGSSNGVRVADPQDISQSDLFDPFFNNTDFTLLRGGSKQGAFGSTNPADNLRAPREMYITYLGGDGERVRLPFETWMEERTEAGATDAQPLADPDGDRIPNALEWVLGGEPFQPFSAGRLEPEMDDDGPAWRISRRADTAEAVKLVLEISEDLENWQRHAIPGTSGDGFTITEDSTDEGFEEVTARLSPGSAKNAAFARIAMDAARVVAVDAAHYDGPYLLDVDGGVREIRVSPGPGGPVISDVTHAGGLPDDRIAVYPDAGAPGADVKHTPFLVRLWDFPINEQWDYEQPDRIFAIADVECKFSEVKEILMAGGVIDERLKWIYGENHLVVGGDVFSRGTDMTALLWLIYKLDNESRQAGGRVHFLMGNHEWMNLSGDERYVVNRYLETAEDLEIEFKDLFGSETELGRWIRSHQTLIRIGRNLFTHAGISREFVDLGYTPEETNTLVRENIGLRRSHMDERADFLFRTLGPLWFRGMVSTRDSHSPITAAQIDPILEHFDVDRIVVGHTKSNEIRYHRDFRVVCIDVDHTGARARGDTRALEIVLTGDGEELRAIDDEGVAREIPLRD